MLNDQKAVRYVFPYFLLRANEINFAYLKSYLVHLSVLPRTSEIISLGMVSEIEVFVTCVNFFTEFPI